MAQTEPTSDDRSREQLYDVLGDDDRSFGEKRDRVLEIGCAYLGVENGHMERIDGETHEVVASVGSDEVLPVGTQQKEATSYCRRTVAQDAPLALSDAPAQGWGDDPAYEQHGFDCYLGAKVDVDGELWGTVCFVSRDARDAEFSSIERAFVELVARMLGRELETREHERELDERDVELDRRKQKIERTERKYASLMETAPDAILLADANSGEIVEANDVATELTGYDHESLVGMDLAEIHPPDERDVCRGALTDFDTHSQSQREYDDNIRIHVRRADGVDLPVELSAGRTELDDDAYVQVIARDISEREERARELRILSRAVDDASIGITIAKATDGVPLVYANDEFERLTGYDRADAMGQNCRFLQGDETDPEAIAGIRSAIENERAVRTELLNYRADGTPFWNELTITPVEDATGETTHFVGFQRDVTERRRRDELSKVLNRVLRHNLRNRVNAILGFADLIEREADGRVADLAGRITRSADDLSALSEQARRMETVLRDRGSPTRRDLVPIVERVVASLRQEYPDADIETDLPEQLPLLLSEHVADALHELGENAIKHGSQDPIVTFSAAGESGDESVLRVHDEGPGLPDAERAVLRTGRETQLEHGSGLGLWFVNWVVTDVGGTVSATVDDGTTITLRFTQAAPDDVSPAAFGVSD